MPNRTSPPPSVISRRTLFAGASAAAVAAALSACASQAATPVGTASSSSTSAAAVSSTSSSSASGSVKSGSIASLALAFSATLSTAQRKSLLHNRTLANAKRWSNLPQNLIERMGQGRIGLQFTGLSSVQTTALHRLLKAATGTGANEGWAEIQQLWNADDYLAAHGGGTGYGRTNYYIAFLGSPGDTGTWELQFGGHHLALANTYKRGALIGATPSFRGVEPFATFTQNGTTNRPLQQERSTFSAMLKGLTTAQLSKAKLSAVFSDLVLGPGKDWAFPTAHEGLPVSALSASQKKLVSAAIARYTGDITDADGAAILAKYVKEFDSTYVAYSGTTDLTARNDYVRIDGPSIWLEFSMQHGIVLSGNHPHSVWRDRTTDYGGLKA